MAIKFGKLPQPKGAASFAVAQAQSMLQQAMALHQRGQLAQAKAAYEAVLKLQPKNFQVLHQLGVLAFQTGDYARAVDRFRQTIAINPDFAEAYSNCGNALHGLQQFDAAVKSYNQAIAINPNYANAYANRGLTLQEMNQLDAAVASYDQAIAIKPDYAKVYSNRGNALRNLNQLDAAIASYDKAIAIAPDYAEAYSNRLFCLDHSHKVDARQLYSEHLAFGHQFEPPLRATWQPHHNSKDPIRRLKVGFVSGDLRTHPVSSFLEPVLQFLAEKASLSIHAYYNLIAEDEVSRRLRGYFADWHAVAGCSDVELSDRIRSDDIDILIDLSGHTPHNRLLTFARKPAPVQVAWIGYPGTTGLQAVDYILCDRFWIPGELAWQFTEKVVSLPSGMVFQPSQFAPLVKPLPALQSRYITFGSFNHTNKINPAVIALWSSLLRKIPSARMAVGAMAPDVQDALTRSFLSEGITLDRLTFFPRTNTLDYLALHHQVDICLDTFPYGGGTTTIQAAWMGVPTLTLAGDTPASRSAMTYMNHCGLNAFVATSHMDFLDKGIYWSNHIDTLAALRLEMRTRFNASEMGRPQAAGDAVERAIRTMWRRWCSDLPPAAIDATACEASQPS